MTYHVNTNVSVFFHFRYDETCQRIDSVGLLVRPQILQELRVAPNPVAAHFRFCKDTNAVLETKTGGDDDNLRRRIQLTRAVTVVNAHGEIIVSILWGLQCKDHAVSSHAEIPVAQSTQVKHSC